MSAWEGKPGWLWNEVLLEVDGGRYGEHTWLLIFAYDRRIASERKLFRLGSLLESKDAHFSPCRVLTTLHLSIPAFRCRLFMMERREDQITRIRVVIEVDISRTLKTFGGP